MTDFSLWFLWALWGWCGTNALHPARTSNTCWWTWTAPARTVQQDDPSADKNALSVGARAVLEKCVGMHSFCLLRREVHPSAAAWTYLRQRAATHGKNAVVADFQQRDAKAPLVSSTADRSVAVNTLGGDPRDPIQTFCGVAEHLWQRLWVFYIKPFEEQLLITWHWK